MDAVVTVAIALSASNAGAPGAAESAPALAEEVGEDAAAVPDADAAGCTASDAAPDSTGRAREGPPAARG